MSRIFKCFKRSNSSEDSLGPSGKYKLNGSTKNGKNGNVLQMQNDNTAAFSAVDQAAPTGCYEPENSAIVRALRTSRNATHYNMDYPKRGFAVIVNCNKFDNTHISSTTSAREGSEKDVRDVAACFKRLDFNVQVFTDLNHLEFDSLLDKLCKADHSDNDCLVVVLMSHGTEHHIYMSDGVTYPVSYICSFFHANNCPTLAGKPKLFFIQACRGDSYDDGFEAHGFIEGPGWTGRDQRDTGSFSYFIPNQADILVAFSSPFGHYSWRDKLEGSWFIQALCKILNEKAYDMEINAILTFVAQEVALNRASDTDDPATSNKRQVPCKTSTLIRLLQFTPKKRGSQRDSKESDCRNVPTELAVPLPSTSTYTPMLVTPEVIIASQLSNASETATSEADNGVMV